MFAYAFTKRRMYETRKLKKGRFKEICFFGSASITKQKMNNKLLTNQSKKCYNLNKARQVNKLRIEDKNFEKSLAKIFMPYFINLIFFLKTRKAAF